MWKIIVKLDNGEVETLDLEFTNPFEATEYAKRLNYKQFRIELLKLVCNHCHKEYEIESSTAESDNKEWFCSIDCTEDSQLERQ